MLSAPWIETKYFFSVESTRALKNSVKSIYHVYYIKYCRCWSFFQKDIEQGHVDFYRYLYSSEQVELEVQQELWKCCLLVQRNIYIYTKLLKRARFVNRQTIGLWSRSSSILFIHIFIWMSSKLVEIQNKTDVFLR